MKKGSSSFGIVMVVLVIGVIFCFTSYYLFKDNHNDACKEIGYDKAVTGSIFEDDYCVNETHSQKVKFDNCAFRKVCEVYEVE